MKLFFRVSFKILLGLLKVMAVFLGTIGICVGLLLSDKFPIVRSIILGVGLFGLLTVLGTLAYIEISKIVEHERYKIRKENNK